MKPEPCPRLFEAEAMRDGRLAGAGRASFERHARTCVACAREVDTLEALAVALRAGSARREDELRARRERTRLLKAFDRELLVSQGLRVRRRQVPWPAVVAAVAAVAAALIVVRIHRASEHGQPVEALLAVIRPDATASWSERAEGTRDVVILERGTLWIHVDHGASTRRFFVLLPDGELEDTGTTFTVSAVDGQTTHVAVQEGSVVLRLRDHQPVSVGPGEVWGPAAQVPPASSSASPALHTEPAPSVPQAPTSMRAARPQAPIATGLVRDPSVDFRDAMAALDRGSKQEAAAGFARFLANYPRDPRAEDAAYLRIIALQRCGDESGMRAAAVDYLHRYPVGFRRAEVEPLSR